MKTTLLAAVILVLGLKRYSVVRGKFTSDPLTNLPLIPATDSGAHHNAPTRTSRNRCLQKQNAGRFLQAV